MCIDLFLEMTLSRLTCMGCVHTDKNAAEYRRAIQSNTLPKDNVKNRSHQLTKGCHTISIDRRKCIFGTPACISRDPIYNISLCCVIYSMPIGPSRSIA